MFLPLGSAIYFKGNEEEKSRGRFLGNLAKCTSSIDREVNLNEMVPTNEERETY